MQRAPNYERVFQEAQRALDANENTRRDPTIDFRRALKALSHEAMHTGGAGHPLASCAYDLYQALASVQGTSERPTLSEASINRLKLLENICLKYDGAKQVQMRRRERHAGIFRKAAAILGFATAATTLHAQPLEAPATPTHSLEASAPTPVATSSARYATTPRSTYAELPKHLREGIASYYGTTQDRFGLVNTKDPLVRTLIEENGHSLSSLPEWVYAADYLSLQQATALHAKNPNKYRLITKSGKLYDSRTMVAAFDDAYVGKYVEVTAVESGKKAVFRIEDTGAYDSKYGRVIDVSVEGAKRLGIYEKGTGRVTLRLVRDASTS